MRPRNDAERPQQSGWAQRRIGEISRTGRESVLLCAGLRVADQTIDPEIGDSDGDLVAAAADDVRHVDAKRWAPQRLQLFAVDCDSRELAHIAEIEHDATWLGLPLECRRVRRRS